MSPHPRRLEKKRAAAAVFATALLAMLSGCAEPALRADVPARIAETPTSSPSQMADQKRAELRSDLRVGDLKMTEVNGQLVLADIVFDETSWFLSSEAIARLDPLIAYLRASPNTRVKIEGFANDGGSSDRNQQLSLDRAQYVERVLKVSSSTRNAVESFGAGPAKPGARGAAVPGRARDRRVEITLLEPSMK